MSSPRLRLHLRTTGQLIKQSTASFLSSFYTFLFLSLLLFSFRTIVETGTLHVTSFIDRDPSLKSLLSRVDLAGKKNSRSSEGFRSPAAVNRRRRRNRPFLHLSRVGTLDDDFFSGENDDDRSLFGLGRRSPINGSSVNLSKLGSSFSKVVGSGFLFKADSFSFSDEDGNLDKGEEEDRSLEFQLFFKGLELGLREAAALFFLVSFLSAAYGWVILGFLVTHSCILGIVFYTVVNDLLGRYQSFTGTVHAGSRLGIRRLSGFVLMRWAVRDAMTQLLGLWFFGEIEDQYSFFKLFVRLKLMPFSITFPWIRGFETDISGFLFVWFLLDVFVAFVFAVDCWVAIMDARRSGREVVKEGCYLISTMLNQAIQIKCYEAILSGSFVRWVLIRICGKLFASVFQSVVEVYFMVAWLIFYFAARCEDANSDARRFGRRDLEDYVDGRR